MTAPSVEALNQLLAARAAREPGIPRALGISWSAHALALAAALLLLRAQRPAGPTGPPGAGLGPMMEASLIPGVAGPRPQPRPRVAPPPPPPPEPPAPAAKPPEPLPVEPDPDAVPLTRRSKAPTPAPRATPAARPAPALATPAAPTPRRPIVAPSRSMDRAVTASIDDAQAETGTGTAGGGGGLGRLAFTDRWYVSRVQDIVLSNWGNPFAGQTPPRDSLEVTIYFRIQRNGSLRDVAVEQSSGNSAWDRAALRAVENSRLPPLPPAYTSPDVGVHYKFQSDALR